MIKQIATIIINVYQVIFSTLLKNILGVNKFCRFEETCSEFTKRSIKRFGVLKGTWQGLIRVLKCQPFYKAN